VNINLQMQEKLRVDLNEEEAERFFQDRVLDVSLNSRLAGAVDFAHGWAAYFHR
jgi:hypothetical protein